jgi:hypothetical protein
MPKKITTGNDAREGAGGITSNTVIAVVCEVVGVENDVAQWDSELKAIAGRLMWKHNVLDREKITKLFGDMWIYRCPFTERGEIILRNAGRLLKVKP